MSGLASRAWRLGDRDWTRGHGIPFDRTLCPADDEVTDVAAWLAVRFDTLAANEFEMPPHPRAFTPTERWRK